MIALRKLDFGLVRQFRHSFKENAIVMLNSLSAFDYIERNYKVVAHFPFIKALGIECDYKSATELSKFDFVKYVTKQATVTALEENVFESTEGIESSDSLYQNIELFAAQNKLTGKGTTLCVLDTGVSPHLDLCMPMGRIKAFYDLYGRHDFAYDDNGHGTFVAGVALGNGIVSGKKIVGIAPKAELVAIKAITYSGECGAFKILEGMQWILDNAKKYNIKTVCMSFGADPLLKSDPLKIGAETLVFNNITVVCAAGNSGSGTLKSPGISPYVITVGAVDSKNMEAKFSSSGEYYGIKKPDIYAKGVSVKGLAINSSYVQMSGTSVSAPYIAGAVCLLNERYSTLTPAEAKRMLLSIADKASGKPILNF